MRRLTLLAVVLPLGCVGLVQAPRDAGPTGSDDAGEPTADGGSDAGAGDGGLDAGLDAGVDAGRVVVIPSVPLSALPDNTALDLGPYNCRARFPDEFRCYTIHDYSRLNYDPFQHRVLMFGGGHAATGRTDVDVFAFDTLTWSSLYPSMTCAEVSANDYDARGVHRVTGHPAARHTYDQNVVATVGGEGRLMMFSTEGFAGTCHSYDVAIRSVSSLPLTPGNTTWTHSAAFTLPWSYAGAAEFDPVSGKVILLGQTAGAGEGGMWVYDPATDSVVTYVDPVPYGDLSSNLVYFPPNDRFYLLTAAGSAVEVWEYALDRANWSQTTRTVLVTTGTPPRRPQAFAVDTRNHVILAGPEDHRMFAFDPQTRAWTSPLVTASSDGGLPGTVVDHMLDYDPVDNVFIFLSTASDTFGVRTWAYRYRN